MATVSDPAKLPLWKEPVTNYNYSTGFDISGLKPGAEYYYRIISKRTDGTVIGDSGICRFTKLDFSHTSNEAEWAKNSIFYEIFVRSFYDSNGNGIGDFAGLTAKLDYLKELGIDAIWLMPIHPAPCYHGYDVADYQAVNPDYGTMEQFETFISAAHAKHIKVIIDWVVNHSSSEHPWFVNAQQGSDAPYRNYYIWADAFDSINTSGWYSFNGSYFYSAFWSGMPDLNLRNPMVREEIKESAKFWLDKGVDGFRLDAAQQIDGSDSIVTHNWWQEFNAYVKSINPDAYIVGEIWDSTSVVGSFFKDMDSVFNFPFAEALVAEAAGTYQYDLVDHLNTIHSQYRSSAGKYIDAILLTNHDMNRVGSVVGNNLGRKKLAAALLLTMPGTPFLYYGEEIGQLGTHPEDLADEYRREPMDWYTSASGTGMTHWTNDSFSPAFTIANDGISVQEEREVSGSLLQYYKKLIKIRKQNPEMFTGSYTTVTTPTGTYGYDIDGTIRVIHNLTANIIKTTYNRSCTDLMTGQSYAANAQITLGAFATVILK